MHICQQLTPNASYFLEQATTLDIAIMQARCLDMFHHINDILLLTISL